MLPERTRSDHETTREKVGIVGMALLGLLLNNIGGCGDSLEPSAHVGSMRVDPVLDGGGPAESSTSCADGMCEESKLDDRWHCPASGTPVRAGAVHYSVRVVDFINGMPRQDVKAKACRNSDPNCDEPVATFVDTRQTGQIQLELPRGFTGFFELTSDAVDTLLYVTKPIDEDTVDRDISVPTPDTINLLASLLDYSWDMDKGLVVLEVLDCSQNPQTGIHFDCREGGDAFYMVDGVPFKTEQVTSYDATNNTAEGGFINVSPGLIELSAQVGTDEDAMSLGHFNVEIRPRTLTIIELRP